MTASHDDGWRSLATARDCLAALDPVAAGRPWPARYFRYAAPVAWAQGAGT